MSTTTTRLPETKKDPVFVSCYNSKMQNSSDCCEDSASTAVISFFDDFPNVCKDKTA